MPLDEDNPYLEVSHEKTIKKGILGCHSEARGEHPRGGHPKINGGTWKPIRCGHDESYKDTDCDGCVNRRLSERDDGKPFFNKCGVQQRCTVCGSAKLERLDVDLAVCEDCESYFM